MIFLHSSSFLELPASLAANPDFLHCFIAKRGIGHLHRRNPVETLCVHDFKMHLGRATSLFSVLPLFATTCLGLPVHEQRAAQSQVLGPRATYSVVPIDGGPGPGGSGGGGTGGSGGSGSGSGSGSAGTVTVTVVETAPLKTSFQTIYVTSPPTTERVTDTVIVTKTVEIVNSIISTAATSPTSTTQASRTTPPTAPSPSGSVTTSFTSIAIALQTGISSSTTTYDDGKWHTSYPAWNGTLPRRGPRNWPRPRLAV